MPPTLTSEMLLAGYCQGFFPMPHPSTNKIQWYDPDPRAILPLNGFHCSHSLRRTLKRQNFKISIDRNFSAVIDACSDRPETWINDEIKTAYTQLHKDGYAHSIEVWQDDQLVGGTYGVCIRSAFFAESKFHKVSDASKVALYFLTLHLQKRAYSLLEIQFLTPHLQSLGASEVTATAYRHMLRQALGKESVFLPNCDADMTYDAASLISENQSLASKKPKTK